MPQRQAGQEPEGTEPTTTPEEQAAAAAAAAAAEAEGTEGTEGSNADGAEGTEGSEADGESTGENEQTPAWKAKQEASANREAANYRVKLRESEAEAAELRAKVAELTEKIDTLQGTVTAKTRETVAAAFSLPPALAAVLKGETEEELRAHAEELSAFTGDSRQVRFRSTEGVGGLDANSAVQTDNVDTALQAARAQRY